MITSNMGAAADNLGGGCASASVVECLGIAAPWTARAHGFVRSAALRGMMCRTSVLFEGSFDAEPYCAEHNRPHGSFLISSAASLEELGEVSGGLLEDHTKLPAATTPQNAPAIMQIIAVSPRRRRGGRRVDLPLSYILHQAQAYLTNLRKWR